MAGVHEYQPQWGTALATFPVNGTYSRVVDMGGLALRGLYVAGAFGSAAGSVTFRASADPAGTGFPVHSEAGVLYRVAPLALGTYYQITIGSVVHAPYLVMEVGTAGTAGHAAGGTVVLVGAL